MIRQTVRSAALVAAGLLLANVAWGQGPVLRQVVAPTGVPVTVASEYFGGEARTVQLSKFDLAVDAGVQSPFVGLNLDNGPITAGNVAEITFTLAGATLSGPASPADLSRRDDNCGGDAGTDLTVSLAGGGARGDSSVTFRVEVASGQTLGNNESICYRIPSLDATLTTVSPPGAAVPVRGVTVTASKITQGASSGTPFPTVINGADYDHDKDSTTPAIPGPITLNKIFTVSDAVVTGLGTGDTGLVDVADRTKIAKGGTKDPSVVGTGGTMGLRVGTLSVTLAAANTLWKLSGGTSPDDAANPHPGKLQGALDPSLSGSIKLSVGGRFQSGDVVIVSSDDAATALRATPSGQTADVTVPIETGVRHIVYVPGGVDALKPGTFAAGGMREFNDRRNNDAAIQPMSYGTIKYDGVEIEGYAYGVVRGGGTDASYLRVTCEHTKACQVFLDCRDMDGNDYFDAAPSIPAGDTKAWSSDAIAGVLGGGWASGRGRCDLHSNGELSVQHMVRAGHVLVNNSAVVGRSLDERTAATNSAVAAVKAVVDSICRSVGDESTGTDRDTTTSATGTQLTACYIKEPWSTVPPPG